MEKQCLGTNKKIHFVIKFFFFFNYNIPHIYIKNAVKGQEDKSK